MIKTDEEKCDQERQWEIRSRQMRRNPVKSPMSSPTWALTQSPHWARQHPTSRTLGPPPPPESIFVGISGTSAGVNILPGWNCKTVWFIVQKRNKVFAKKVQWCKFSDKYQVSHLQPTHRSCNPLLVGNMKTLDSTIIMTIWHTERQDQPRSFSNSKLWQAKYEELLFQIEILGSKLWLSPN